jgi:hypothetical protein
VDQQRFDRMTKLFAARRLSRRTALARGGAGLAASALAAGALGRATAQEASPAAGEATPEFLFVQSFERGALAPKAETGTPEPGTAGAYTLTLSQGLGQTLFFSNRPERIVGAVPTPRFIDALGFSPDNPPNAALVADLGNGDEEILVVELSAPTYDEVTKTATYEVRILDDTDRVDMAFNEDPQTGPHAAADYGASHLFVDDCPDTTYCCLDANGGNAGYITVGTCWSWKKLDCLVCRDNSDVCNARYPDQCQGNCHSAVCP